MTHGGRLAGLVALITGAGSGMGAAGAERFVAEGARVLVVDVDAGRAHEVAGGLGAEAVACVADVTSGNDVARAVGTAVERFGRLDVMWNNAGVPSEKTPIHDTDEAVFDGIVAVNLKGVWLGIRHAVRAFLAQGEGGSIISTASISAVRGMGGQGAYGAAKAGVCQLTRVAAVEYATYGIRCNAILPGAVLTPLQVSGGSPGQLDEIAAAMLGAQPLPRVGTPEDIAAAAVFLASADAAFVTGVCLPVDGGRTVHLPHRRPGREVFDYLPPVAAARGVPDD